MANQTARRTRPDAPKKGTTMHDAKKTRVLATIAGFNNQKAVRNVSLVLNGRVIETRQATVPEHGRVRCRRRGRAAGAPAACGVRAKPELVAKRSAPHAKFTRTETCPPSRTSPIT